MQHARTLGVWNRGAGIGGDSVVTENAHALAILDLLKAVRDGDSERVRTLLEAGADPNTRVPAEDGEGSIPLLFFPSQSGNVDVARVLLEHGANPTDGESVHHAAQHDQRGVLQLLVDFGADLSRAPAEYGNTPLYFLASHRVTNPIAPKVVRGIEWLLEHGADPTVPLTVVSDGQSAVQLGETPLHRAAANGYGETVLALFVAHGAEVDTARHDGATPYTLAVRSGNAAGALWLASRGADRSRLTTTDRLLCACLTGDAADAQAIVAEHPDIVASLSEVDAAALLQAMVDEKVDAVRLMLSLGWPLTPQSEWGGTVLHWAAWNAQVSLVHTLLEHGAPVNLRDTRYGSSPIAWAAHGSLYGGKGSDEDYVAIVNMLLDSGATREEAINRWHEPPEALARPAVVDVLKTRGFVGGTS